MASPSTLSAGIVDGATDPLAGVDHIVVIDSGAHNIRIATIPYPFPSEAITAVTSSLTSSTPLIDPAVLAQTIAVDVFPNAIARTRTPHTIPSLPSTSTSPTAPPAGTKTSIFVSSHIHTLLDDYAALHLRLPHQSGIVVDWAAQKTIWDHVLTNHLAKLSGGVGETKTTKLLAGKAVIITEPYLNLEHAQHATDLLFFEHYGAQAVWRTTPATLVGLGTDVFRSDSPLQSGTAREGSVEKQDLNSSIAAAADTQTENVSSSPKRPFRSARTTSTESNTPLPRLIVHERPQSMLVLDLGYSFCHAIPVISGHPHYPSIRRLELGGKMLINLLKETLSFQQLDMMDESWLMSHIFSRTSFVAAEVGRRVYGSDDKVEYELNKVYAKNAADWSYHDLLLLNKYGKGKKWRGGGRGEKRVDVTWSLPDYGGSASGKGGNKKRDRARYGYNLDGPNSPPFHPHASDRGEVNPSKRQRCDSLLDWESSFIAKSFQPNQPSLHASLSTSDNETEDTEDKEDLQTLTLSSERFSIIEHLFNPISLGLDQKALPELVLDSVTSVSTLFSSIAADMMWNNIVLVGGVSNTVNMRRRLENELRPLAPADVPLRMYPDAERVVDKSLVAIKAGVSLACEISAKEAVRRENKGDGGGKNAGRGGKKKIRGKASRGPEPGREKSEERGKAHQGRWLTYAQWINPSSGGGSDADVVKAANATFYPSLQVKDGKSVSIAQ